MRQIKFRIWNTNGQCFHDWRELVEKNKIHLLANQQSAYPVMQFTGLTDINGVEIYEGDIVLVPGEGNCEVKISAYYGVVYSDIFGYERPHADCAAELDYPTIIGNIYQNPELLK